MARFVPLNWYAVTTFLLPPDKRSLAGPPVLWTSWSQSRRPIMSRHWHRVSQPIQKLAASMYPIMSEGMSPYEMYYVLATDEEIHRLNELNATMGVH
jgi:hypothetical protein